tara:strand:- start:19 stop:531 length:513 start_codon:yes stop_codon:yes gene_type:complete
MKIIKNFLPEDFNKHLEKKLLSNVFPWYFHPSSVISPYKEDKHFVFYHEFITDRKINSEWWPVVKPLADKIKSVYPKIEILRIKANLYTNQNKSIKFGKHIDNRFEPKFWSSIYYVNSNNGKTHIGKKVVSSVANSIVVFDGKTPHYGMVQTDTPVRLLINVIFKTIDIY